MNFKSFVKKALLTGLTLAICIPVVSLVMNANAATEPSVDISVGFYDCSTDQKLEEAHPGDSVLVKVIVTPKTEDGDIPAEYVINGEPNVVGLNMEYEFSKNDTGSSVIFFAEGTVPEQGDYPYCSFALTNATISGNSVFYANQPSASLVIPEFTGSSSGDSSSGDSSSGDSSSGGSSSSGSSSSGESSGSSDAAPAAGTAAAPAAVTNKVNVGGRVAESTVGGVYTVKSVNGVAVTSPVANVAAAAGLSEADVAAGTNVRFYVCDSRNREMKDALKGIADTTGRSVVAYINADLYTITKSGVVTNVRNTSAPVTMTFGLPGSLVNAGHTYSILCMNVDGTPVVFEDVDTDNATITINATVFGTYAVVINP